MTTRHIDSRATTEGRPFGSVVRAQGRPIGFGFASSVAVHAALVLIALLMLREGREAVGAVSPTPSVKLVWIPAPEPGGGGGGGGGPTPQPARRAEAPGRDRMTATFAPPAAIEERPVVEEVEPIAAPTLDARSLASATALLAGVTDDRATLATASAGPGRDGAGSGGPGGSGEGHGPGVGPGRDGGVGGGPYHVGGSVIGPQLVRQVTPRYTTDAMRARLSGSVILDCVVLPDGSVSDIRVVRSLDRLYGLDEEAVKAARAWRFIPGRRLGEPVPVAIRIELMFSLR